MWTLQEDCSAGTVSAQFAHAQNRLSHRLPGVREANGIILSRVDWWRMG